MQSEKETNVNKPLYSSLCTILQVALIEVLRSFDVKPAAVVGHSSGEIAAAQVHPCDKCQQPAGSLADNDTLDSAPVPSLASLPGRLPTTVGSCPPCWLRPAH